MKNNLNETFKKHLGLLRNKLVDSNIIKEGVYNDTWEGTVELMDPETGDDRDFDVSVDYEYESPSRGERERSGLQISPDYGANVTVYRVIDAETNKELDVSDSDKKTIANAILDDIAETGY
jgi:hypothetical protein